MKEKPATRWVDGEMVLYIHNQRYAIRKEEMMLFAVR